MKKTIILILLLICSSVYSQIEPAKIWTRTYNSGVKDVATKSMVDNQGNLIIAGYRSVSGTTNDSTARMLVIKYDPQGEMLWQKVFHSRMGRRTVTNGLDVDDSGNVVLSGLADTSVYNLRRGVVVKFSPAGDTLWARYSGFPSFSWIFHDVKIDAAGDIYLGYELYVPPPIPGNGSSCSVVKYSSSGVYQWTSSSVVNATNPMIEINTFGSIFMGATTTTGGADIRIVNIDNTGTQQWSAVYNSPGGGADSLIGMKSDPVTGDLVAIGWSMVTSNSTVELQTIKFTSGLGQVLWAKRTNGTAPNAFNSIKDFEISPGGDVYVCGQFTNNTTGLDGFLIRYNTGGNEVYRKIYNYKGGATEEGISSVDVGSPNEPVVAGFRASVKNTFIFRYSTSGGMLWKYDYNDSLDTFIEVPSKVLIGNNNRLYAVNNYYTPSAGDINAAMWDNIPVNHLTLCKSVNIPTILGDYIYDTISVNTGTQNLVKLEVVIDSLTHSDPKNLILKLKTPHNTTIELFRNSGLSVPSSGLYGTIFSDTAQKPIDSGSVTYTGYFLPFQPLEGLNSYSPDSNWVLMVYNMNSGAPGVLKKWCIRVTYQAPVGIQIIGNEIPKTFSLSQNYPNPFNPVTNIKFSLPKSGNVTLKVYDILGRQAAELVNEYKQAGSYVVDFNAADLSNGVYFYRIETADFTDVKKMVLVK